MARQTSHIVIFEAIKIHRDFLKNFYVTKINCLVPILIWSHYWVTHRKCYKNMITFFFLREQDDFNLDNVWFQDGATCHTVWKTINLLKDKIRVICRFGNFNWSPRRSDLTPLDYLFWDSVKSLLYLNNPQSQTI